MAVYGRLKNQHSLEAQAMKIGYESDALGLTAARCIGSRKRAGKRGICPIFAVRRSLLAVENA
jgi:hypothetical protein